LVGHRRHRRDRPIDQPCEFAGSLNGIDAHRYADILHSYRFAVSDQLEEAHLTYDLNHVRDSLMVVVAVPQDYCAIAFFPDESIEVE